ncbi:MAG TPA: hypothetical protein PLH07_00960 [Sulfurovum sp.]|nr:hypothetical protein [Sulfurovum sp.]HQS78233.1 hypothetical protein [Sulfurovum sp.]HQT27851.1 hypothetical protein [Sulfurovum sp.]
MYSREKIKNDLLDLGIKKGDTLLVRADLGAIGKLGVMKKINKLYALFIGYNVTQFDN